MSCSLKVSWAWVSEGQPGKWDGHLHLIPEATCEHGGWHLLKTVTLSPTCPLESAAELQKIYIHAGHQPLDPRMSLVGVGVGHLVSVISLSSLVKSNMQPAWRAMNPRVRCSPLLMISSVPVSPLGLALCPARRNWESQASLSCQSPVPARAHLGRVRR